MDEEGIRKCAEMIREGKIGIFPTETVYGIGTDARNSTAAQKIFEVKGRKSDNPFIVHISDFDMLKQILRRYFNEKELEVFNQNLLTNFSLENVIENITI